MATWKELKAQGVKRCFIHFNNGKQCRRRATNEETRTCEKHAGLWRRVHALNLAIVKELQGRKRKS